MRVVSLALFVCLWFVSQAPAVLAGTRATLEDSARINGDLCRGGDGNWYPAGAKQCRPPAVEGEPTAPTETARLQQETEAARASDAPKSGQHVSFLAGVAAAVVSLTAIVIAAIFRTSRRASEAKSKPEGLPPNTPAQNQPGQGKIEPQQPPVAIESVRPAQPIPPTSPVLAEQTRAPAVTTVPGASSGDSAGVHNQPAPAAAEAHLVNAWTGPSYAVEFTYQHRDGERQRRKVSITRISRDPADDSWHLHGFCHLEQEERDFDAAGIVTKILYKSRRWDLEDWISAVAGEQVRDS